MRLSFKVALRSIDYLSIWAVESKETGELIGFIDLTYTDWKSNFTP